MIDCVATDHAPHAEHEKLCEFAAARPGMLGLQTALSVVVETMVRPGLLTWRDVARVMSENPARIVGLPDHGRPLDIGEPANLTVVDPDATWTVARRRSGEPVGQHAVRIDDAAGGGHRDAAAGQGHRTRREVPGVNTGTLVASLIIAAVLAVVIAVLMQAMMRGWRRRAERQAELIGTLPPLPEPWGRPSFRRRRVCTSAAHWCRTGTTASPSVTSATATKAVLTRYPEGIMLQRSGARPDLDSATSRSPPFAPSAVSRERS